MQSDADRLRDLIHSWKQEAEYLRSGVATPVGPCHEAMAAQALAHAQQVQDILNGVEFD